MMRVRIPPAFWRFGAGALTGVSAGLYCAMLGVGAHPIATGVVLGGLYAAFFALEADGPLA